MRDFEDIVNDTILEELREQSERLFRKNQVQNARNVFYHSKADNIERIIACKVLIDNVQNGIRELKDFTVDVYRGKYK